jgi:enoyl-CoA hydratase
MDLNWIDVSVEEGIVLVSMRRPPANAIDIPFLNELAGTLSAIERRSDISAVVLTGAGRVFSAGLDLKQVPNYDRAQQNELLRLLNEVFHQLYALRFPTVAAINGHAIAGGLILALACDLRVAVDTNALFGLTEVRVGVPFPVAAMAIVRGELAPAAARELVLAGKNHGPARALALGIVDELLPADRVLARSIALARHLAAAPSHSYRTIKHQLRRAALAAMSHATAEGDPLHDDWIGDETKAAAARMLRGG